jgi:endonuclease YncB( thermonuclease family)
MIPKKSPGRSYPIWIMHNTKSPCCKAKIICTDVITETGLAKDISFTPTSITYCSKCKAVIDQHPAKAFEPPGILPTEPDDPTPATAPALPLSNPKTWKATVKRVIDADTIEITFDLGFKIYHTARLRLANVDACEAGTPPGDEATGLVKAMLEGKTATITTYQTKDKFGRYLADVLTAADVDLAQWIRSAGFAKP